MSVGRDLCPRCRADVLHLPTDAGPETFDAAEYALDDVEPDDRFVVLAHRYVTKIDPGRPPPNTCLRLHRCPAEEATSPPPPRPEATPPGRADFAAARRLETVIHLYRAQKLGTLRTHAGQRTYEPVAIAPRLASIARLRPDQCALCRTPLASQAETIVVGTVEADPPYPLRACRPTCPDRASETL
jgi:hypothetical protein